MNGTYKRFMTILIELEAPFEEEIIDLKGEEMDIEYPEPCYHLRRGHLDEFERVVNKVDRAV